LLAVALVLGLATAAQAQYPVYAPYGYGYAVPVVPVTPQPYTAFSSPYTGTVVSSPGFTYFSSPYVGTVQMYNANVAHNAQAWRANSTPLYPSYPYRRSGR
jgi:hypothetical protein